MPFVLVSPTVGEDVVLEGHVDAARLGVLMSSVAGAWIRRRLQAGATIEHALTTFPYPEMTDRAMMPVLVSGSEIENIRGELTAREAAVLYSGGKLPAELLEAHLANDRKVRKAYGVAPDATDDVCLGAMDASC